MELRPHLLGMVPEELATHLGAQGCAASPHDVRRLLAHVIFHGAADLDLRHPLPRRLRRAVDATTVRHRLEVLERATDPADGFVKYLLRSPDGALSEAVRIPLHVQGRYSVCLSSQVGCAMRCAFCLTGRLGLTRNLAAWEMVSALLAVRDEAPGRVTGAVFMGQGEPLANYDEVIRAARVLAHPCGGRIAGRAVSISTVGLVEPIRRYARERQPFRLITSLTSAIAERRRRLLPVAGRQPLGELVAALREYAGVSPGRLTVAWVVLAGVNTDDAEVDALAELFRGVRLRLNVLDLNGGDEVGFARASQQELGAFIDKLQRLRSPVVRRYSGGASCQGACGLLRNVPAAYRPAGAEGTAAPLVPTPSGAAGAEPAGAPAGGSPGAGAGAPGSGGLAC